MLGCLKSKAVCGVVLLHWVSDAACQAEALTPQGSVLQSKKPAGQGEGLYRRSAKTIGHQKTRVSGKWESYWLFGVEKVVR